MQQDIIDLNDIFLAGVSIRTNNHDEMDPTKAKISSFVSDYHNKNIGHLIQHRKTPGKTFAVYCKFENQDKGEYTYFIGEEVKPNSRQLDPILQSLTIPASRYQKMTSNSGPLPDIVIQSWQHIWQMPESKFAGARTFVADFEVYDNRATDPSNAIIDIYLGIS